MLSKLVTPFILYPLYLFTDWLLIFTSWPWKFRFKALERCSQADLYFFMADLFFCRTDLWCPRGLSKIFVLSKVQLWAFTGSLLCFQKKSISL